MKQMRLIHFLLAGRLNNLSLDNFRKVVQWEDRWIYRKEQNVVNKLFISSLLSEEFVLVSKV